METIEVKIEIPEGYEIDKENSTFERIVFKPIDDKPRSWEEYCENNTRIEKYFIHSESDIFKAGDGRLDTILDRNVLPSKELAEAFLAMMQLMSLRQAWIGDWEPDWENSSRKFSIINDMNIISVSTSYYTSMPLSFPKEEMAEEFMDCFKDLLEIAKPLI